MGVNIDEILASLETEKTAEATLAENLSVPEENVATEAPDDSINEATSDTVELTEDDMQKIAAECDAQGRIMARSFVDEINRIADDNPDAVVDNSGHAEETYIEEEKTAENEFSPAEQIVGNLYHNYFGEEE
jgi:hypothetical protein